MLAFDSVVVSDQCVTDKNQNVVAVCVLTSASKIKLIVLSSRNELNFHSVSSMKK